MKLVVGMDVISLKVYCSDLSKTIVAMEITQHLCVVFITQSKVGCLTKGITCGNFRSGNQVSRYLCYVTCIWKDLLIWVDVFRAVIT